MTGSKTINLLDLEPGMRVVLANGDKAEVVDNPQDGMWVICRYVDSPSDPGLLEAGEVPVFAPDIVGVD